MTQKTEQKAKDKKAVSISSETQKHLQGILATHGGGGRNKFGHLLGRPGAFIDEMLEQGKGVDEIVAEWNKQNPDKKPITAARIVDEIKHLLAEHSVNFQVEKKQPTKLKKV